MVTRICLLAALLVGHANAQQPDPVQALSPRVRAMLPLFPPPYRGDVSVTTRFSAESVYTGEQVELVTATWFARDLLAVLRRQPSLRAPTLSGLWSTQAVSFPSLTMSRVVNGRIFDLYLTHQTLFPLGSSTIEAPAAELNYSVPLTSSFFSPEERRTTLSKPAKLVVRAVPSTLAASLGSGPTARDLTVQWRGPAAGLRAGTPASLELVVRGSGNLTLWPAPEIAWPTEVRVYPEPTIEAVSKSSALIGGEKRFRFTVVVDSAGVLALPVVRYPFFDPTQRKVQVVNAAAAVLPIAPSAGPGANRRPLPLDESKAIPLATFVVSRYAALLWLLALLPVGHFFWHRRRPKVVLVVEATSRDAEDELRRRLGTPIDAAPEHVVQALRKRGVPKRDAETVRQWLTAAVRNKYGATPGPLPTAPSMMQQVLARLRGGLGVLLLLGAVSHLAAQSEAESRYQGGDYPAAATLFEQVAASDPEAPALWGNLAAARWLQGDDVGAAAAWLNALHLAPRDARVQAAWRAATLLPDDVRQLAPTLPVSGEELLLLTLVAWLTAWVLWSIRWRRVAAVFLLVTVLLAVGSTLRWLEQRQPRAIIREGAVLRISPTASSPALGAVRGWSVARVERVRMGWYLVNVGRQGEGWIPMSGAAQLGPPGPTLEPQEP